MSKSKAIKYYIYVTLLLLHCR